MKKLKTYYVPVETTLVSTLVINAINQTDATNQVSEMIEKNKEALATKFDSSKILYSDITCEQDDEMLDEIIKDFNLEVEVTDHPVVSGLGEDTSNKQFEIFTSNLGPNSIGEECISQAINDIVIYTGTECPWCHKTMKYLSSKELLFTEKNVNENKEYKEEMIKLTRQSSLPALIINNKVVLGFDKRAIECALNA